MKTLKFLQPDILFCAGVIMRSRHLVPLSVERHRWGYLLEHVGSTLFIAMLLCVSDFIQLHFLSFSCFLLGSLCKMSRARSCWDLSSVLY